MRRETKNSISVATRDNFKLWTTDGHRYDNTPSDDCGHRGGKNQTKNRTNEIKAHMKSEMQEFFKLIN